jgi:hypothetical protein
MNGGNMNNQKLMKIIITTSDFENLKKYLVRRFGIIHNSNNNLGWYRLIVNDRSYKYTYLTNPSSNDSKYILMYSDQKLRNWLRNIHIEYNRI